ncbi:chromate resistance protein ChrB domain-containing protein [Zobellella sp. DQSA1]|uniref:chromate resistance protein ChrB domain-containing protein n=1 Tax=Zobellella sp. DQSA1 TaxID=3342386 RepID=UPI0035C04FF2
MNWLLLILTLPTENATARMRAWRALKASGAAVLRDGVYLLPARDGLRQTLRHIARDVDEQGGTAFLLDTRNEEGPDFLPWFDRTDEFNEFQGELTELQARLAATKAQDNLKQIRKLRKRFGQLAAIDFFPDQPQRQTEAALVHLEREIARRMSPDEPSATGTTLPALNITDYRNKLWATRARPWVDRLASAWLIRRCIDPDARLLWLTSVRDCPPEALGFDFDGAAFSHAGDLVTFEVLLASFGLGTAALQRLAGIVHYLDVGGVPPPEASGIESLLAGLRDTLGDDDALLAAAGTVFDGLLTTFEKEVSR